MPISVYKLLYKDQDCTKLEPSTKADEKTYTTEKIKIVGSCKMFIVHPNTKLLHEVTFQVTNHEGSVIVSCATSLELGLIHPHRDLNELPEEGSLICSRADMQKKNKNKNCQAEKYVHMQSEKPATSSRNKKKQCILTRTVKQIKMILCGQWPKKKIQMCSYTNQQGCVETRTVNLQDVIWVQGDQYKVSK